MKDKFLAAVEKYRMLPAGTAVTVALSGGADSMALLHLLLSVKDDFHLKITAAHMNHQLRGAESDADEAFARSACSGLGVPLAVERADIRAVSKQSGESIELCARNARYDFLRRVAEGVIATAHTRSDSLETILFQMARGTGLKGLCGIPPVRGGIIRPLIDCTRAEVEAYCRRENIPFVTDSSNFSCDYARNKLRHRAVPVLLELNPALYDAVGRMIEINRADAEYLERQAEEAVGRSEKEQSWDAALLAGLHPAIRTRAIGLLYRRRYGETLGFRHIMEIDVLLAAGKGRTGLPSGRQAGILKGRLYFSGNPEFSAPFCTELSENPVLFFGRTIGVTVLPDWEYKEKVNVNSLFLKNAVDYDKITGKLLLRNRLPGDKLYPAARGISKSLKKLLNEAAVPPEERGRIPILADDAGIVWMEGFGADRRTAVDETTRRVLVVEIGIL